VSGASDMSPQQSTIDNGGAADPGAQGQQDHILKSFGRSEPG